MKKIAALFSCAGLVGLWACGVEHRTPSPISQHAADSEWPSEEHAQIEKAQAMGWHRQDPLIQHLLLEDMHILRPDTDASDATLLKEAYALGLQREDPLIRKRLLQLLSFEKKPSAPTPSSSAPARTERVIFHHYFFGDDHRAAINAASTLEHKKGAAPFRLHGQQAFAMGHGPFRWTRETLERRFGQKMAHAVWHLPHKALSAPILSPFGWHLVQIEGHSSRE